MPLARKVLPIDAAPTRSRIFNAALIGLGALLGLICWEGASAQTPPYDLVLRNARIVDGSGNPAYRADLAIRGDTIVRIAPSIAEPAARVIDVGGQVLAPGFIDVHTHAGRGIFEVPTADNYVRQGVTTIMEGPDGSSPVPLAPFLARLAALPKSINIGSFIGQGSVRRAAGLAARRWAKAPAISLVWQRPRQAPLPTLRISVGVLDDLDREAVLMGPGMELQENR